MSELTARLASTALRILTEKGVVCSVTTHSSGAMNAAGDRSSTPVVRAAMGVEFPTPGDVMREGERVRRGTVLLTPVDPWPSPGDVVEINDHQRLVTLVENWAPDGLLVYSSLEVEL